MFVVDNLETIGIKITRNFIPKDKHHSLFGNTLQSFVQMDVNVQLHTQT